MNPRYNGVGIQEMMAGFKNASVCDILMEDRNRCVDARKVGTDIRDVYACACCEFDLGAKSQQSLDKSKGMYFEDVANLIEVRLPSSDFLFAVCVEGPEERIPFATFDDVLLDFSDSPEIES